MRAVLHIVTETADELAFTVIKRESEQPDVQSETMDIRREWDYGALLEKIFSADSVQVW